MRQMTITVEVALVELSDLSDGLQSVLSVEQVELAMHDLQRRVDKQFNVQQFDSAVRYEAQIEIRRLRKKHGLYDE